MISGWLRDQSVIYGISFPCFDWRDCCFILLEYPYKENKDLLLSFSRKNTYHLCTSQARGPFFIIWLWEGFILKSLFRVFENFSCTYIVKNSALQPNLYILKTNLCWTNFWKIPLTLVVLVLCHSCANYMIFSTVIHDVFVVVKAHAEPIPYPRASICILASV